MSSFRRNQQIEMAPYEEESILFNPETKQFVRLNKTTAVMWERLSEVATKEELVSEVCENFSEVETETASSDVQSVLDEMVQLGLIEQESQEG